MMQAEGALASRDYLRAASFYAKVKSLSLTLFSLPFFFSLKKKIIAMPSDLLNIKLIIRNGYHINQVSATYYWRFLINSLFGFHVDFCCC